MSGDLSDLPFFSRVHIECGPGWNDILRHLAAVVESIDATARATLVKEKLGLLRVYWEAPNATDEQLRTIGLVVANHERMSATACEKCGKPGESRTIGGRMVTMCDDHYAELSSFSG